MIFSYSNHNSWFIDICSKVATAMFGYMTDLSSVDIARTEEITAEGNMTNIWQCDKC